MPPNSSRSFRLGFVVNPFAGVGGPIANKGSDDGATRQLAFDGELTLSACQRAKTFLQSLLGQCTNKVSLTIVTVAGSMGEDCVGNVRGFDGLSVELIEYKPKNFSSSEDTQKTVVALNKAGVDLLVFVGGDGTARDICLVNPSSQAVLGVPAGVKMHSGVYAINPQLAADVTALLIMGEMVSLKLQEVRDIDEDAFRGGVVKSQYFGEMLVPEDGRFVQSVKQGGLEVEELVLMDIAEYLSDQLDPETLLIMGPGSTTFTIQKNWGLGGSLLGIDLIKNRELLATDVTELMILNAIKNHSGPILLVVTAIGGQGHVIGRGNQQLSAAILRLIGRENLRVVATKSKIKTLKGKPLMLDSGDPRLDVEWSGYQQVISGYDDCVFYPMGCIGNDDE